MRDEVLRALDNPGEVTHAELARIRESGSQKETRCIGQRMGALRRILSLGGLNPTSSYPLGDPEVETRQVAAIVHAGQPNDH
jgi:hypothetical protein